MAEPTEADALIAAIDQGTSSTKVIVVNAAGDVVARATAPLGQAHPEPGWVEQDPKELLASVVTALEEALASVKGTVVALGLSSQRESAVSWDRATGEPLGPMLGWQDRRTASEAQRLQGAGHDAHVRAITGLPIDPMFSALKFAWLLDHVDPDRKRANAGEIALGTVDSWILYSLTGEHRIEIGNASRTQLLNLDAGDWDDSLLELFRVPRAALPKIVSSVEHSGPVTGIKGLSPKACVTGVLGDSHAALFGHGSRTPGAVKVTYGTGSSIMGLLPEGKSPSAGLVRTIAWGIDKPVQAFEGNILSTGATLVWLSQLLGKTTAELNTLAQKASDSSGVSLVPAFSGLGAPWWDEEAQGIISGLTLGTSADDLARAAFESITLQVEDVLVAADSSTGQRIDTILADGRPSANEWLMQLQSDLSQRNVIPSSIAELSSLGAAHLAGESIELWTDAEVLGFAEAAKTVRPKLDPEVAMEKRAAWLSAISRATSQSAVTTRTDQLTS